MKLSIALDLPTQQENLQLLDKLRNENNRFDFAVKVGPAAFIEGGLNFIAQLKSLGIEVCLDLKLFDIPNTMSRTAVNIADLGVDMFTIHASAGTEAMETVAAAVDKCVYRPKILAVTVLTSMSSDTCYEVYGEETQSKVESFAASAAKCGMDGIVCSAQEAFSLKPLIRDLIFYCPGIRWDDTTDDQTRVSSVELAFNNGVDYIVVGRPIYESKDPRSVLQGILDKIRILKENS